MVTDTVRRDSGRTRITRLKQRVEEIDLSLEDLSSAWIDALDDWQTALRDGPAMNTPEGRRLEEIESQLRGNIHRQKHVRKAFEAALDNLE